MKRMSTQEISLMLCEVEAGKEEVNIAQMNEIVSKIPVLLYDLGIEKALAMLNHFLREYAKEDSGYFVETAFTLRNDAPDAIEILVASEA
jgi:hypothetical protein